MTTVNETMLKWTNKSITYYVKKVTGKATIKDDINFLMESKYNSERLTKKEMLLCSEFSMRIAGYKHK